MLLEIKLKSNTMREKLLWLILLAVLILYFLRGCEYQKQKDNLVSQLSAYQLSEQKFTLKVKADSSTIAQQSQTILSQDEAIMLGLLKLDGEIKDVVSQVSEFSKFKKDSFKIPFIPNNFADTSGWYAKLKAGDTSRPIIDSLLANSVIVPKPFAYNEKYFTMGGNVNKKGLFIDSIHIPNETRVTIGNKRSGFLGLKVEPVVEVTNSNPYIQIPKLNNVIIKKDKPFYEKKLFLVGVGIVGGYYIKTKIN